MAALSMIALPVTEFTGYLGITIGGLLAMFGGFVYFTNEGNRQDAIIITMFNGEKVYIFNDLEQAYSAIMDAIVLRAQ